MLVLILVVAIFCAVAASNRDSYRVFGLEKYGAKGTVLTQGVMIRISNLSMRSFR